MSRGDEAPPEILCFRHELTDVPSFEFSLRERVARLAEFRHPYYARIRKVDRLSDERGTVALMSDCAPGSRLIEILKATETGPTILTLDAALCLIRQLAQAMTLLHKNANVAHGAMAPERLILTPQARLFIVEHVTGAALEQLRYSRERYWKELRVALPVSVGLPRFDEHVDLTQLGVVALALILGRPLRDEEYPSQAAELVASAMARNADGSTEPLPGELRTWLTRALQLDVRHSFRSLTEAQNALGQLLTGDFKYSADVASLEALLDSYYNPTKPAPTPVAVPKPAPVTDIFPRRADPPVASPVPATRAPMLESFPDESADDAIDAADGADSEEWQPKIPLPKKKPAIWQNKWVMAGAVGAVVAVAGLFTVIRRSGAPAVPAVTTGMVTVNSNPPGGKVEVDGIDRGQTPLTLSLPPGAHTLVVRGEGEPRTIPISITAGTQITQYLELPTAPAAAGQLQIRTEPSGARISVDGVPRGVAPLMVPDLSPGTHSVKLESDLGAVTQTVTIEPGVTNSLVVPLSAPQGAVTSGWVSVNAPFDMDLYEQGKLLGNTSVDRIMLPTGRHDLEIVSSSLGYRETRTVQITPGRVSNVSITLPKGTVSLNAIPWATVSIDGENVGDTPIGNLSMPIGPHEVVFRNPQLGEQRRVITVTQNTPVRFSIDLTKK